MFLWQSVSHLVLSLGEMGIKRIGNEDAVVAALRENIQQPGFYFFRSSASTAREVQDLREERGLPWLSS